MPASPFDAIVASLVVENETVETILDRIALLFGGRVSDKGSGAGVRPGSPEEQLIRKALARPLSFSLERTTIREILDTLCRTQGTLSWYVEPVEQPTNGVLLHRELGQLGRSVEVFS